MGDAEQDGGTLDLVFGALADPVRRAILNRLDGEDLLVTELAGPFAISLQAVSRHIQVLVRAGLVTQERSGRISRCRLDAGPILTASLWLNRYSRYWQSQFDTLAMWLDAMSPPLRKESPHVLPRDDRPAGRVPQRDRRAARQDAAGAGKRRARGGG
ncbi:MAG TPA: metalloregulator ArsR/SmtB family transcription factor [Stellaceae bacterium]|jgi:DNA-binding transcriptional ArsR family regulator|nr:metalloregulator ArsR/SmtB family transcription factor [Stellaceae bacterium]